MNLPTLPHWTTRAVSWVQLLAALCAVGGVLIALERRLTRLDERQQSNAAHIAEQAAEVAAVRAEVVELRVNAAAKK